MTLAIKGLLLLELLVQTEASFLGYLSRRNEKDSSVAIRHHSAYVDCQVEMIAEIGQDAYDYRCVTYPDEEVDGIPNMVYELPDFVCTALSRQDENKPVDQHVIRIHGAHLGRSSRSQEATAKNQVLVDSSTSPIEVLDQHHRNGSRRLGNTTTGIHSILVVRIETSDAQVSLDASTISDRMFGTQKGTVSTLMKDCSVNQLQLVPAVGVGVVDGVLNVTIDASMQNEKVSDYENTMIAAIETMVGTLDQFDHYIICVPAGAKSRHGKDSWRGYAAVGGSKVILNDDNCGYLGVLQHELGHNLALGHSGLGTIEYNDKSGMMGVPSVEVMKPLVCFNGAKNWQLGFFQDKALVIQLDAYGPWMGRLYGFTEYNRVSGNILLRVGNLFLQYNMITDINDDTPEKRNQVAVTESTLLRGSRSWSKGGLDAGESLTLPLNSKTVVIEVCSHFTQGDYFDISIYYSTDSSMCESSPSLPYPEPTAIPVRSPTLLPTLPPVARDVVTPSIAPIASTHAPSRASSEAPSDAPSPAPTMEEFSLPTMSVGPSWQPSISPAAAPSEFSTISSSGAPSFNICDDDKRKFFSYSNGTHVFEEPCIWLSSRKYWKDRLCVEGESAYDVCEETCDKCHDSCADKDDTFLYKDIKRSCAWLSLRLHVQEEVCFGIAGVICPETCDWCDAPDQLIP